MHVRSLHLALLVVLALLLAACGASEEPLEPEHESEAPGIDEEPVVEEPVVEEPVVEEAPEEDPVIEQTVEATPPEPPVVTGEAVSFTGDVEFTVLGVLELDEYAYVDRVSFDGEPEGEFGVPRAGKFVVVNYSVRNVGSAPSESFFGGTLDSGGGQGQGEFYDETDVVTHPETRGFSSISLQPREIGFSQLIFDVPTDFEPAAVNVGVLDDMRQPIGEGESVSLTEAEPQAPGPDERLALYYEYLNMEDTSLAYGMFSSESQALVSEEQYAAFEADTPLFSFRDYAFRSVEVSNTDATLDVVREIDDSEGQYQDEVVQPMALEEDGWRLALRDDQVEAFTGG